MSGILISFDREELNGMGYPVMVEMWDKVMGSGSKLRKYRFEFTESERRVIRDYYNRFYQWYLVKGTPDNHCMKFDTYLLLNRAIGFFASV